MSREIEFNKEEIISKAMNVFWSKGYESTTLKDLTEATGLLKGSIYNTFKSKENLFLLCLEHYGHYSRSFFYREGDAKEYLKTLFNRLVSEGIRTEDIKGCLIMNSCLEFANQDNILSKKTSLLFSAVEKNLDNVVKVLFKNSPEEQSKIKTNLTVAAFSIKEISKFKKDEVFLKQIANNALRDLSINI